MQVQSLSEMRAEIEREETEAVAKPVVEVKQPEAEAIVEEVAEEVVPEQESTEESTPEEDDKPEWAKTEGQAVPVAKYVDLKHKLKATKAEADGEIERLRQELEAIKRGNVVHPQAVSVPKAPTLEDCGYDEALFVQKYAEHNEKYVEALIESKLANHTQRARSSQQAEAAEQGLKQQVDKHYERASEFVAKGIVSEENYRNADAVVRRAVQGAYPTGNGDAITDALIANIGEGSEKVLYHLGANPNALAVLEQALRQDPSGLKASAYLGGLKVKFESAVPNKLSNAPKPDVPLKGNVSLTVKSKQSDYDKALAKGDVTMARTIKKAAQSAGADTSNW